jgi:hypothetical protein
MAGHGISASKDGFFSYTCQEHGFIIGLISVMPDASYSQGVSKMFTRFNRFDYAWPDFAHLGEQQVHGREVYIKTDGTDEEKYNYNLSNAWGYMPRFGEYRFNNSKVTGLFRPGESLAHWTLTRAFDAPPQLNEDFIVCNPSKRIFAVESELEPSIIAHVFSDVKVLRKLPKYGTPGW